ncbi:hypothetical protein M0804_011051 [Polistes exclamans]|nr:hypothetical protein M0804_011051 [Polistes exclamans]
MVVVEGSGGGVQPVCVYVHPYIPFVTVLFCHRKAVVSIARKGTLLVDERISGKGEEEYRRGAVGLGSLKRRLHSAEDHRESVYPM